MSEFGTGEVNPFHETILKTTFIHPNSTEISEAQVNFNERTTFKISPTEVSFPVDSASDGLISQTSTSPTSEILVSPSILSEQFLSIHETTPQIINALNDTATNIWSNHLQNPTPLDIDFQIIDLPTGQLAEATITGFDDYGTPNAGTILIDHDANGVGWFIDSTPEDNSEFIANGSDTYLLAAAESEATDKYDLLTTVLHELAHLYGFIEGYSRYDRLVSSGWGEVVFDDSHLDRDTTWKVRDKMGN